MNDNTAGTIYVSEIPETLKVSPLIQSCIKYGIAPPVDMLLDLRNRYKQSLKLIRKDREEWSKAMFEENKIDYALSCRCSTNELIMFMKLDMQAIDFLLSKMTRCKSG